MLADNVVCQIIFFAPFLRLRAIALTNATGERLEWSNCSLRLGVVYLSEEPVDAGFGGEFDDFVFLFVG